MQYWEINNSKTCRNPFLLFLFTALTLICYCLFQVSEFYLLPSFTNTIALPSVDDKYI